MTEAFPWAHLVPGDWITRGYPRLGGLHHEYVRMA
jgi:hypothetical protein